MNHAREFFWWALQHAGLAKRRKHHFVAAVESFLARLKKYPGAPRRELASGGVGVLMTPWLQTSVPLFSAECARRIAASGECVTLMWDATNLFGNAANTWEAGLIEGVVSQMRDELNVVALPGDAPRWKQEPAFFEELLTENAVQSCRGECGVEDWLAARPEVRDQLRAHIEQVAELFRRHQFDWLFIPGGIWAVSGVHAAVALEQGISIVTFDSGPGALYIGCNGVAAHFPDVAPVAQSLVEAAGDADPLSAEMETAAREKLEERMRGQDEYRLQPIAAATASSQPAWDILVALNLRWDSAALCRRRLFADVTDWLSQLLAWVESHPSATLAIRQHPCEKIPEFRGVDDFRALIARYPRLNNRVAFISAEDVVNTYDLINAAKVVLPYTSRVGIEAAMLGKPVILGTQCYYAPCGFTCNPASVPDYFAAISQALSGGLIPGVEARRRAFLAYYLAERCLELKTRFTPAPQDFAHWVKMSPAEIWETPENEDLLTTLLKREPMVSVRHRRLSRQQMIQL